MTATEARRVNLVVNETVLDEAVLVQKTLTLAPPQLMEENFQFAPNVHERADKLIAAHGLEAKHFRIAYLWRKVGGKSKGKNKLGDVKLITGPEKLITKLDATIWLAADHFENTAESQIEAQIFHLLCHIGSNEESGDIVLLDHDWSGFNAELDVYGAHDYALAKAKAAFEQAVLPMHTIG